jgi:hypothetical protein
MLLPPGVQRRKIGPPFKYSITSATISQLCNKIEERTSSL